MTMNKNNKIVSSYLNRDSWSVKENSTVNYSIGRLIIHNSGEISKDFWLSEVYDKEIAKAHKNADIHLHDLTMLT